MCHRSAVQRAVAVSIVLGVLLLEGCGYAPEDSTDIAPLSTPTTEPFAKPPASATAIPSPVSSLDTVTPVVARSAQIATVQARRADIAGQLKLRGQVVAAKESALAFKRGGEVKAINVKVGDAVTSGTVLIELDDPNQQEQEQVEKARAALGVGRAELLASQSASEAPVGGASAIERSRLALEMAKLKLAKLKAGPSPTAVKLAELALDQAHNNLWGVQASRDSTCGGNNGVACDSANAQVAVAERSVVIAQVQLAEIQNSKPSQQEITLAELEVRAAEAELQAALSAAARDAQLAPARESQRLAALNAKQVEVRQLEANANRLQGRLDQLRMSAPVAGSIVMLNVRVGDKVEPLQNLGTIADPRSLVVEATIPDADAPWVTPGQEAEVRIDKSPAQGLAAKVTHTPQSATKDPSMRANTIRLAFADPSKMPNSAYVSADVSLSVVKSQVLVVPKSAISQDGDRRYVMVPSESGAKRVNVVLGTSSEDYVEIVSGLTEGASVVNGSSTVPLTAKGG